MHKRSVIAVVLISLFLWNCGNKRLVIKEIKQGDLTITWYRESYISNTRAFVGVEIKGVEDTALVCDDGNITNIELKNNSVFIKMYQLASAGILQQKNKIGQYAITLKEASYEEWFKHYHPGQKFHPIKEL